MNIAIYADVPFGDSSAFEDFLGSHDIAHRTINAFLQRSGRSIPALPLGDGPAQNPDWLLDHYIVHREIAAALGSGIPDIDAVDLNDESQFIDWMQSHASLHELINLSLRITT